jgi:hypothetical protein
MRKTYTLSLALIVAFQVGNCAKSKQQDTQGEMTVAGKSIEVVLKEHTDEMMGIPGVVGTGQGLCQNKPCIKVFVVKKTPELQKRVPAVLEGYPVELEETGEIRALPQN